jgi:hypothetical protein
MSSVPISLESDSTGRWGETGWVSIREAADYGRFIDFAQGVHDALGGYASERPSSQRKIEAPPFDVERLGGMYGEADAGAGLVSQRLLCLGDLVAFGSTAYT